jgi:transposase
MIKLSCRSRASSTSPPHAYGRTPSSTRPKSHTIDLRSRLLVAVNSGMCCRAAASWFGVAPSMVIRWMAQRRETSGFVPSPGGDMRSRRIEESAANILAFGWLAEMSRLGTAHRTGRGRPDHLRCWVASILERRGITRKKRGMPSSKFVPHPEAARGLVRSADQQFDPEPRSERLRKYFPHEHRIPCNCDC